MLQKSVDWITYSLLKLNPESALAHFLNFFIYDTVKILLLLFVMVGLISSLRTYIPQGKVKSWLLKRKAVGHFIAALFGAVTPFCSCSSLPIFFGFLKADIPLGVAFSFLITSPIVNEYLVVLMAGFFGLRIAILYVAFGVLVGVFVGMLLGRMRLERYIEKDFKPKEASEIAEMAYRSMSIRQRIYFGIADSATMLKDLWLWIIIAVGIGALIHNYVPKEAIEAIITKTGAFSVPLATLLGVPLYGSCAAIVPIAFALFEKGLPLGTALSFMMAVSALSLPQAVMLKQALKLRLVVIFFGITAFGIILIGYIFNFIYNYLVNIVYI